jgi:hypothetical protein
VLEDEEDEVLEHRIQMLHEAELHKLLHVGVVAMGEDLGERNGEEMWGAAGTRRTRKRERITRTNNEDE